MPFLIPFSKRKKIWAQNFCFVLLSAVPSPRGALQFFFFLKTNFKKKSGKKFFETWKKKFLGPLRGVWGGPNGFFCFFFFFFGNPKFYSKKFFFKLPEQKLN